jgi:hypothetical protein
MILAIRASQAQQTVVSAPESNRTTGAEVSFEFERPGLTVPKFTLQIREDGSAHYVADEILTQSRSADYGPSALQHIDRQALISRSATAQIFAAARNLNFFNAACASRAKNIADTGKKTLRYTGNNTEGACTYNFSGDKRVAMLTDLFLGIAHTLDVGRKLEFDHRFDRLGLDAEIALLVDDVAAGRAVELGTIAPTLKSIASDSEVLERVRARAVKLLQQVQPAG